MRSGSQEVARYAYDGQGQRITKTVGGVARQFYYGLDGRLLRETGPDGDRIHLAVDGTPLALLNNGTVYYPHPDRLGTVQRITDAGQQVVWSARYEPFGQAVIASGIEYNPRFPGQYYDAETGLYYNHFRDYDAGVGRYVESDPIGLRGGVNAYAYVGNDPLRWVDPLGLAPGDAEKACEETCAAEGRNVDLCFGVKIPLTQNALSVCKCGRKIPNSELQGPPSKRGNAPIGKDGHPIELHHRGQQPDSPLDEMTRTEHRGKGNFKDNHSNTGQEPSQIDRKAWKQEQGDYWKREWDSGRFDDF